MNFTGKVIYIISHENWGKMLMSKHHYAIELGRKGNEVFFINHPDKMKSLERGEIRVVPTESKNVSVVMHRLIHPFFLKYKLKWLYNYLISFHIGMIKRKIGKDPDIVWSFDTSNTLPLKYFKESKIRILMPVDGPFGHEDEAKSTEGADIIISVTEKILDVFSNIRKPKLQVNHGVSNVFLKGDIPARTNEKIKIGYSGSLLREDIDRSCLLEIVGKHQDMVFEFWGEYDINSSNIHLAQNVSVGARNFIKEVSVFSNVILHGPVSSEELAEGLRRMDALMICYTQECLNSHKMLEYLATGKVIISSPVSSYRDMLELIAMVEHAGSPEYQRLFDRVIESLRYYNSEDRTRARMNFAADHSYLNNILTIEQFIQSLPGQQKMVS